LKVYTDGFRAYEPPAEDDYFDRKYVVHSDGEYAAAKIHIHTCESHGRSFDRGSRSNAVSQNKNPRSISERFSSTEKYTRNSDKKRSNTLFGTPSEFNNVLHKAR